MTTDFYKAVKDGVLALDPFLYGYTAWWCEEGVDGRLFVHVSHKLGELIINAKPSEGRDDAEETADSQGSDSVSGVRTTP